MLIHQCSRSIWPASMYPPTTIQVRKWKYVDLHVYVKVQVLLFKVRKQMQQMLLQTCVKLFLIKSEWELLFYLRYWFNSTILMHCTCSLFLFHFPFNIYFMWMNSKIRKLSSEYQFTSGRIRILQVTGTESPFTSVVRIWNMQSVYWGKYTISISQETSNMLWIKQKWTLFLHVLH